MFKPENQDVFEEVRNDIAPDIRKFFEPILSNIDPTYKIIDWFLDGKTKTSIGNYFINRAENLVEEGSQESEPSILYHIKRMFNETDSLDRIRKAFTSTIIEGKPVEGLLQITALSIDSKKFIEDKIIEVPEDTKIEPWQKDLSKADGDMFNSMQDLMRSATQLEEAGVKIKYDENGVPMFSELGLDIEQTVKDIYSRFELGSDSIIIKNNQFVVQKYDALGKMLEELNSVTRELERLDIKAAAPDIYRKITEQITALAGRIQLITDMEASTRQLNEYNSTYQEAQKSQEEIVTDMAKIQDDYNALLDPEMIEYIESTQRVDTMSQVEFQAMQNYGFMNMDRINQLNSLSQKFEDAKTRLDINSLQAEKASERFNELKATIDIATENLIGITNTTEFKNNLTKLNILSADQADALVQSMLAYREADDWIKKNERAVIDETIRLGDNAILAQAEVREFENEVSNIMDDVIRSSSDYTNAFERRSEALQFQKIADLAHQSEVAEAVANKRYIFGLFPAFGGIFTKGKITTNKEVMREAFGDDYTWADTQEVYWEYLKNRFGGILETGLKALGGIVNVVGYPGQKGVEAVLGHEIEKPSEQLVNGLVTFYTWWYGYAIPVMVTGAATLSDDLDWVGLPTDTPAGHELRNISLPDKFKNGISSMSSDEAPSYNATRGMRALLAWLNMPGPEDQQLLWSQFDKRVVVAETKGKLTDFIDPWDIDDEKRIEEIKKLNPSIKNFDAIPEGTTILLYKKNEFATEYMRKQDALYNFMAGKVSEERFITDKTTNIFELIPRGEEYAETVGAVLDLNDFKMRGIDPEKIPPGIVIRIPKVQEMPMLSNLVNVKNRLELKSKHPILFQIREEAFDIVFDPIDWLWYPAGRAIKPLTKTLGMKAYGKLATSAKRNAFSKGVKGSIDFVYSIGRALRGTGPLPEHFVLPTHLIDAESASRKLSLTDLMTKLDTKNPLSLATLAALSTKLRGISLSKIFPYEVGKDIAMTDKMLNRLRAENEILFIEAIQKVSQQTNDPSTKIKQYVHEYIADPTHASPYAESIFWKFNEHMGLSEGRLTDMMHKFPDSYYDRFKTTKVTDLNTIISKEIADSPEQLATIMELNQFKTLGIDPKKIPANLEVIISDSNFFKELESEIFRGRNMSKFEQLYLGNKVSELDTVGRQAIIDFFQYWDPAKKEGRPIYNQADLDRRVAYWRKKYSKDAPEQRSITQAVEVASFYRDRTEYWAKVVEKKYAVPIKVSDDMQIMAITPDNFMKLTPEERSIWDKNGLLQYMDPDTGQLRILVIHDTRNGLGGDLLSVISTLKVTRMNNLKKMVVGDMQDQWKKTGPSEGYEIVEYIDSKTGERKANLMYIPGTKKSRGVTPKGEMKSAKTVISYSNFNSATGIAHVGDVTANDLLHTAYLNKKIGKDGKGWFHTLDKKQQGELSSILESIVPDRYTKKITPQVSEIRPWADVVSDTYEGKKWKRYDIHKGKEFEYYEDNPDIDIVLTMATSIEDLYHSNRNFYDSLKSVLAIVKDNVDKGVVGYKMDPVDQLIFFLMDMSEGAPSFFARKEHQIIELLLRGQDLTDVNIKDLIKSQEILGKSWARSKRKTILDRRAKSIVNEEAAKELAVKVEFNMKDGNNINSFKTFKEKLSMMPGMVPGGIKAKGNVGTFTNAEAAAMFAKYGDATFMLADRRLNREFSHLFSEKVPEDLLPARFNDFTKDITKDAVDAMAKISDMDGATKAIVPLKIKEALTRNQDSRTYLPLESGDIAKKKGGKLVKSKTVEELKEEVVGELFLPLPSKGVGQKALDRLNAMEKKAAQANVDVAFAKDKLNLARKNKRGANTINRLSDAHDVKFSAYKELEQAGKDYANSLGDESVQFIDRSRGKIVDPGLHEATEFIISPALEKTLESIKIARLASKDGKPGKPNPLYKHRFRLPLDSEEHRLLYEYLRTRDDFIEGIHFEKDVPALKKQMTSEEIMNLLKGEELDPISYLLTKHFVWKDGKTYGLPDDQVVKLINDAIDPNKFARDNLKDNIVDMKEVLSKIELQIWDPESKKFIQPKARSDKVTALEVAKADMDDISEIDLMTTSGYTSKQLGQEIEKANSGTSGRRMTSNDFKTTKDLEANNLTGEELKLLSVDNKSVYAKLVGTGKESLISIANEKLSFILQEWNAAFYSIKKELGIYELRPILGKPGAIAVPGAQLWELEIPPTGMLRENIERRVIKKVNGNVVHEHLLSSNVRNELTRKKPKYREIDYTPEKFSDNIGNAFDVRDRMGPDDMQKWIDDKTGLVNYDKTINPLERKIRQLQDEISNVGSDVEKAITAENLKFEKTKHSAKVLTDKAEKQISKSTPEDAAKLQKEFIGPAELELSKAKKARDNAIEKINANADIKTDNLTEQIYNKNSELSIIKSERDSNQSITRHLLRGDGPQGTLFNKDHGIAAQFIESTYSDVENSIVKLRKEISNIEKQLNEPGKYSYDPTISAKAAKTKGGYIFEDSKGNKFRDIGVEEKMLRISNAKRELKALEGLHDMIIPWNLAKANGIKFTAEELYWAGKGTIIEGMATKLDNLGKIIEKRAGLLGTPDALKAINVPRVTFPARFAPTIDEADVRRVFYDKLPDIKSAKEVTLFKADVVDVARAGDTKEVIDAMQKLLDNTANQTEFPFIYDMTGTLKRTLKREQNLVAQSLNRTKDTVLRAELRSRLKQIDTMLRALTIVVDADFLPKNLVKINIGPGMSASLTEFRAIEKTINKMKERGSVWLFGERAGQVTPLQLKDSIYGKGMTEKTRGLLSVMRDDFERIARQTREPKKGYPHHFPRNPESMTTQFLGVDANGKLTTKSLDKSIKAISETSFKDSANANLQAKIVDYDVGARAVKDYNTEIKGKNVLVRSDKATILSNDFKNSITNAIQQDTTFFFPTVMHAGEQSIHDFIKSFPTAKIKFIDAKDGSITRMVNDKPIKGVTIDYLLSNQSTSSSRAMRNMYEKWGYEDQNRILLSPERMKARMRTEVNEDLSKYLSDPNKFPPGFITDKASRSPALFGLPLQSTRDIVVDWASIKGRQEIKKSYEKSIDMSIKFYRKEMLENLEKKYAGKEIPKWHLDMTEKQIESLRIATQTIGDQVFKFDMPMRTWERWYKNVSDKLFYYTELSARNSSLDDDLNFGMNVEFESYPGRLLMYNTAESIMRWAPVLPNTMFGVGRTLKTIWIWSILLLSPGWMTWNSISDGVRAMVGGRSIRAFIDMQQAFIEGYGHLFRKLGKEVLDIPGDIRSVDIVARANLKSKSGRAVAAKYDPNTNKIYYDRKKIQTDFDGKVWTKSKVKGVTSYPADAFKAVDEWENFVIAHERINATAKLKTGESKSAFENRINAEAFKLKGKTRFQVFDVTRIAEIKRTEWNPLTSQKFRDAWLAREKRRLTPKGELIDIDDWEHISSSGLTQVSTDPERAAAHAKVLREDGILRRLWKRRAVIKGDIEIFSAQMEEARRQIMAFDLIYRKAFTKAEANIKVKTWLFDYRDLTLAGQAFRTFFPFYTFTAKSLQLYLSKIAKYGPGVYNAANGILDAWEDVTYELPDQYKDRIKLGNRTYWLTRFGIQEYAKVIIDPWNSLKGMVDNPLKVAFNLGWGPFSSTMIGAWQRRGFWETGPLMRDFSATGWYKEEIDRYKERDDARFYDEISFSKDGNALMTFLLAFIPPTQILQDMFNMDVGFTLRGGSILQSKKARSLMKFFGLNILHMDDIAYVFDRLNKLPPHLHYFYKKSLEQENPELYNYFRQYQILSRMNKILKAEGTSREEKITELHETLVIDTYYEKEFQKNGSGDAWLTQNPEFRKIVDDHFNEIFAKRGITAGAIIGKKKFELSQVDASLRKMFEQIKTVDAERVKKMDLAGIDHPFKGKFDKQELRDALYNADGSRKFRSIDEAVAIVDKFDALLDLLELDEYKVQAEKTFIDWQLLAEAAKEAKRESDAKYYRRMGMIFSVIPEGIEKFSDEEAQKYWDKWRLLKETLIDSVPEYKKRYEDDLPEWQKDYYAKNAEYMSIWAEIRKDKDEDDNFFDKFYAQPNWFQKWYFLKHPKKALYFPIVSDYTKAIGEIIKKSETTGEFSAKDFHDALTDVWNHPNALNAWDEANPGIKNYIDKMRQLWAGVASEDDEDYFDLFYQKPADKTWNEFREYYFNKPENEYKRITYPFIRTWINLIEKDGKNDTDFASQWFWSPNHTEARRLYGEKNPIDATHSKLDYQQQWKDWSKAINEDPGQIYDLVLDSEKWFKDYYFQRNPDREEYYELAADMQHADDFATGLEMFFDPKNKAAIEAWEKDKPGTVAYNKFWKGYGDAAKESREAALDFYFLPKNAEARAKHESNNPGANEAFSLWRDYSKMPNDSWEDRKARRQFLIDNPGLREWWNRGKEMTTEEKEVTIKEEIYYTILDRVNADGKGRQYYLDYFEAKAEAKKYLEDNPDLKAAREERFKNFEPVDKTIQKLLEEYNKLTLQEDKNEFLRDNKELDTHFLNTVPPGIRRVWLLQRSYFNLIDEDEDKQRSKRKAFLELYPELIEYWDSSHLPSSKFTDPDLFASYQTQFNKASDYFAAAKAGDWDLADKLKGKLPQTQPDNRTEEGQWLIRKLYNEAMATWATTFGSYMSTYYFRSLPLWLRNEYYRKHPESKLISYTPMSRSLNNAVVIENSKYPDLTWARRMMRKYGKDLPFSISKQVQKIMTKWGEWDSRENWTSRQWSEWWEARTARLNRLRQHDLDIIPLLRKELSRANKMFSYSMLPLTSRKHGVINPFLGDDVLLPELTIGLQNDIIKNK